MGKDDAPIEDRRNVRSNIDVEPRRGQSSETNRPGKERKGWKKENILHDDHLGKPSDFEKVCHNLDVLPQLAIFPAFLKASYLKACVFGGDGIQRHRACCSV